MLFRPQLSLAVVSRGDEFLYRGRMERAVDYYARAISLDANSDVAVDRYAFFRTQLHDEGAIRACLAVADRFLAHHEDPTIRADRALCNLRAHKYGQASNDFARAGYALHDSGYLTFAGWAALHAGDTGAARALWRAAAVSGFEPAREALRQLR
jgi:tetratricopeptide (TPR) repeat protein